MDLTISDGALKKIRSKNMTADDFVLIKTVTNAGHEWAIKSADEVKGIQNIAGQVLIQGNALKEIFQKVANHEQLPKQYEELRDNKKFRRLSLKIPGIEEPEHKQKVQSRIKEIAGRVTQTLKTIGQGTKVIKTEQKPWKFVDTTYVAVEVIFKDHSLPFDGVRILVNLWQNSEKTKNPLNIEKWVENKKKEWSDSKSPIEFLPWLARNEWKKQEKAAFELEHPPQPVNPDHNIAKKDNQDRKKAFAEWKSKQTDPNSLLALPKWCLKKQWTMENENLKRNNKPAITYDTFIENITKERRDWWAQNLEQNKDLLPFAELTDRVFKKLDRMDFEYSNSGSCLDPMVWIGKELWKETQPVDKSDSAFIQHIQYRQCKLDQNPKIQEKMNRLESRIELLKAQLQHCATGVKGRARRNTLNTQINGCQTELKMIFEKWQKNKESALITRWKATGTSLPFDKWKSQQVMNPLAPQPFVRLSYKEKLAYRTDCKAGVLSRQDKPFPTTEESTMHSGKGTVIFVIGANDDLYCASHLGGVFHHSSFLSDAAIRGGGELQTDTQGKITHISSKSGHYKPSRAENLEMLRWFEARGTNLAEVTFSCFLPDRKESAPMNALDYLRGYESPTPQTHLSVKSIHLDRLRNQPSSF